jgi:orotate phosphoribosyltransferase
MEPIAATDAATPWYFYGCGLTLHDAGIRLAADALLAELAHFRSTQIATYGMSALPLLGAMIARSPRPLTGLFVRKEAKTYGLRRLVEGEGDRARPVVYVDESMTYGGSAKRGIAALEADGYEVEGVLALVDLAGHGTERLFPARGYAKRVVFDVYADLGKLRDGPARAAPRAPVARSDVRLADGLSPADAVPAAPLRRRVRRERRISRERPARRRRRPRRDDHGAPVHRRRAARHGGARRRARAGSGA